MDGTRRAAVDDPHLREAADVVRDARKAFTQNGRLSLCGCDTTADLEKKMARRVAGKERWRIVTRHDNQAIGAAMRKLVAIGDGFRGLHLESM